MPYSSKTFAVNISGKGDTFVDMIVSADVSVDCGDDGRLVVMQPFAHETGLFVSFNLQTVLENLWKS